MKVLNEGEEYTGVETYVVIADESHLQILCEWAYDCPHSHGLRVACGACPAQNKDRCVSHAQAVSFWQEVDTDSKIKSSQVIELIESKIAETADTNVYSSLVHGSLVELLKEIKEL